MPNPYEEHTILVAFTVYGDDRKEAQESLLEQLPKVTDDDTRDITSWWIAEDDRIEGSDNDSAVFVDPGSQAKASRALRHMGYTAICNVVDRESIF